MIGYDQMKRATLSPRELEILTWAAKGKTYWEIARILGIAYPSVHSHINGLRLKLNAVNTTQAVARGYELGLIELRTAEPRVMMAASLSPADVNFAAGEDAFTPAGAWHGKISDRRRGPTSSTRQDLAKATVFVIGSICSRVSGGSRQRASKPRA